jgi:glyoxylase-like metal-dependent hydrolase (beta-lactamase superfamily II)
MRKVWVWAFAAAALWMPSGVRAQGKSAGAPGCESKSAKQCVELALDAMGGREQLQQLKNVRLQNISHTLLMEQSYRQAPFITSYERGTTTVDFANQRLRTEAKITWPEADANQSDFETVLIVGTEGGVSPSKEGDSPCGLSELAAARQILALGPERLLLTASVAADLRFEAPETVRSTAHAVVAFTWQKIPVRVLLNPFNHLPDALETTQEFQDFWYFWGDVRQRIYFDNWKLVQGITYPTNLVEERNGVVWSSTQALNVEFNIPIEEKAFAMDAKAAKQSGGSPGWNRPFHAGKATTLAPGVDLFLGSWNSTIVKQPDGIVILEAPISGLYAEGVIEEVKKRYPGEPVKAVLSTSDSWPHTGGVRAAVAQGLPLYILDLNEPLLDKMMSAPHTLDPDALENSKGSKTPIWKVVSGKEDIGSGENRVELYPLRGASTERQYMVYFPESRLLYASDTLAMNGDGTLYDPELMLEVVQAVKRANLKVDTVFAMHQGPMPWDQIVALVEKAQHS